MAIPQAPDEKAASLLIELVAETRSAASNRWGRKFWGKVFWYMAVACTAAASLLGFVAKAAFATPYIEPWMVSLLAAAGGSIEIFRNKTVWRAEENVYAEYRDTLAGLVMRLRYELPSPPTLDQIAQIAGESRNARERLTQALTRINNKTPSPAVISLDVNARTRPS